MMSGGIEDCRVTVCISERTGKCGNSSKSELVISFFLAFFAMMCACLCMCVCYV